MSDNLDEWLNSLGVEPAEISTSEEFPHVEAVDTNSEPFDPVFASDEEPQTQTLSDSDFDDILGDFGFTPPENAEAEEVIDENEEEEDANFQTLVDSGGVVPVGNGITDQIGDAPVTAEEVRRIAEEYAALDSELRFRGSGLNTDAPITTDDAVHFHMPDGEVVDVPVIHEETPDEQQEPSSSQEEPLIPQNSPALLLDESTTRFSGAEWYSEIQKQSIIVAGIGGIGSNLAFQLSRMHPAALFMYDDDNVEVVNMAGQLYARNDVGKSKVNAMSEMITAYTNMQNVYALKQRFEPNTEAGNIMMCGFDNMQARKTFFERWAAHIENKSQEEKAKCLFLDGRLSIDTLQVFCITGDDYANANRYLHEYLFSDEEAEHTVCSMKQTTYLACMIGSIMVNLFTNFIANQLDPVIPYDLPFFTEYDAQNMIFKTIK